MRTHLIPREPQSPPTGPTSQHHVAGEGRGGLRIRSTPPPQKITPIKRTIVQHRSKWKTFHVGKDVRTAAPSASLAGVRNGAAAMETGQGGGSSVQRAQTHTRASRPSWAGAWRTGRRASDGCRCRVLGAAPRPPPAQQPRPQRPKGRNNPAPVDSGAGQRSAV